MCIRDRLVIGNKFCFDKKNIVEIKCMRFNLKTGKTYQNNNNLHTAKNPGSF